MKKWLILFVMVDFIFVGLVLKLSTTNQRNIANDGDPFYSELTEGQKNKYDFVKSFQFSMDNENLTLQTDRLQALCETNSVVELKFKAVAIAYAGVHPSVSHIYSCENIRKDMSRLSLSTSIQNFIGLHKKSELKLVDSLLKASKLYSDEEFPAEWTLAEVIVSGELNFSVSEAELEKAHPDHQFVFNVATFVK